MKQIQARTQKKKKYIRLVGYGFVRSSHCSNYRNKSCSNYEHISGNPQFAWPVMKIPPQMEHNGAWRPVNPARTLRTCAFTVFTHSCGFSLLFINFVSNISFEAWSWRFSSPSVLLSQVQCNYRLLLCRTSANQARLRSKA